MSFNYFQTGGNSRNLLQFPPPPGPEPLGGRLTTPLGTNQHGVSNSHGNNALIYLGHQGGYAMCSGWIFGSRNGQYNNPPSGLHTNWTNQPSVLHGMGSVEPQPGPGYFGPAPLQGSMPFYSQNVPFDLRCRCPIHNAPESLEHPQNQIVTIRTPDGGLVQLRGVIAYPIFGPSSTTATVDLGMETPSSQQGQPGVGDGQFLPISNATATEEQKEQDPSPLSGSHQSSQENLENLSNDIDSSPTPVPEAESSSNLETGKSEDGASVDKCEKQTEELVVAGTSGVNPQPKKSTSKRQRSVSKKGVWCRLCFNNREVPEVYRSHNLTNGSGVTTCPYLRKLVCPCCKATGDKAHTLKFCPVNINNRRWFEGREIKK